MARPCFHILGKKKKDGIEDKYLTQKNVLAHQQLVICLELLSFFFCFFPTFSFPHLGKLSSVFVCRCGIVSSVSPTSRTGGKESILIVRGSKCGNTSLCKFVVF